MTDDQRPEVATMAKAIKQLRQLDKQLVRNGYRSYSESLRAALAELEDVRQFIAERP